MDARKRVEGILQGTLVVELPYTKRILTREDMLVLAKKDPAGRRREVLDTVGAAGCACHLCWFIHLAVLKKWLIATTEMA